MKIVSIPTSIAALVTVSSLTIATGITSYTQPATAQTPSFQQQILQLVNAERKKVNAPPLTLNSKLNQAAQNHTNDMVAKRYFSHTSPSGSTMVSRVKAVGYSYRTIGENIAAGKASANDTMIQWMNSAGHRKNILNPSFKELGVGYAPSKDQYRHYWTQVFGTAR
jgi:uncharacterized protein YkwD